MADLPSVDCSFYVRERISDAPEYRYTPVSMVNPRGDGHLHTEHPPVVGDYVYLRDKSAGVSGGFVVIARSWKWPSFGSVAWPYAASWPQVPAGLDLIVEAAEGPFVNEWVEEQ